MTPNAKGGFDPETSEGAELLREHLLAVSDLLEPQLGRWQQDGFFRELDPMRLVAVPVNMKRGGSEVAGAIRCFVGEAGLSAGLLLAADISASCLALKGDRIPEADKLLRAVRLIRSQARGFFSSRSGDREVELARMLFESGYWRPDSPDSDYFVLRALIVTLTSSALYAAAHRDAVSEVWPALTALSALPGAGMIIPSIAGDLVETPSRPHDALKSAAESIPWIGRRILIGNEDHDEVARLLTMAVSRRCWWHALDTAWRLSNGGGQFPEALSAGTRDAVDWVLEQSMTPVASIDGAGEFQFPLFQPCRSGKGLVRRILGYALKDNGEAAYVIWRDETNAFDVKRAWRANIEYESVGQAGGGEIVPVPHIA